LFNVIALAIAAGIIYFQSVNVFYYHPAPHDIQADVPYSHIVEFLGITQIDLARMYVDKHVGTSCQFFYLVQ